MVAACPYCGRRAGPTSVVVSLERNMVTLGWIDMPIGLTPREAELLQVLAEASPRVVPHGVIIARVWGGAEPEYAQDCLKVYVRRLRKKLSHLGAVIRNELDRGYWLDVKAEVTA